MILAYPLLSLSLFPHLYNGKQHLPHRVLGGLGENANKALDSAGLVLPQETYWETGTQRGHAKIMQQEPHSRGSGRGPLCSPGASSTIFSWPWAPWVKVPKGSLLHHPAPPHSLGQFCPRSPPRPPGRVSCSGLRGLIPQCPQKTEFSLGQELHLLPYCMAPTTSHTAGAQENQAQEDKSRQAPQARAPEAWGKGYTGWAV